MADSGNRVDFSWRGWSFLPTSAVSAVKLHNRKGGLRMRLDSGASLHGFSDGYVYLSGGRTLTISYVRKRTEFRRQRRIIRFLLSHRAT